MKATVSMEEIIPLKITIRCPQCSGEMLHNSVGQVFCKPCEKRYKLRTPIPGYIRRNAYSEDYVHTIIEVELDDIDTPLERGQ